MVQRLVEPGTSFFDDIASGFDGDDRSRSPDPFAWHVSVARLKTYIAGGVCGRAISGPGKVAHQSRELQLLILVGHIVFLGRNEANFLPIYCCTRLSALVQEVMLEYTSDSFAMHVRVDSNCRTSRRGGSSVSSV
ncbi:hypothetical protein [Absidia glauca]|uniref:Uncharacterized protein n=1 Tax=Absidia glauca TaxID=4829 RepID=A0A168NWY8_ABSGL|nr:hypothetical protein [Absidia glauca]